MATKQEIREYFARFGKKGGQARARNMTSEQRSEAARKAVEARWAKAEKKLHGSMVKLDSAIKDLQAARRANNHKRKLREQQSGK